MRETRPSGSVRGVRRKPYPYRDTLTPDAVGGAKTLTPETTLRDPTHHVTPDSGGSAAKGRTLPRRPLRSWVILALA
jgi:hypothetical protein